MNAVAARAIARASARIEAYEFDVRERAFFNERLQSERRREQDRLKAEADAKAAEAARRAAAEAARRAEADRRARAEAARLEKQRRDDAERRSRAAPPTPPSAPTPRIDEGSRARFEAPKAGTALDPSAAGPVLAAPAKNGWAQHQARVS